MKINYTVKEILNNFDCLKEARLVAGFKGLENKIRCVNIMEMPKVAEWMKGGEFLLTAAFAINEYPEIMIDFIKNLNDKNVACLGIKIGHYLNKIPDKIIEDADKYNLPVIIIPKNKPYMDIMMPLTEEILNRQTTWMKKEKEINSKLMNIIISGKGLTGICKGLTELINLPVFIFNEIPKLIEYNIGNKYYNKEKIINFLKKKFIKLIPNKFILNKLYKKIISIKKTDYNLNIIPVPLNNKLGGYLVTLSKNKLKNQKIAAIKYASLVTSIEFSKQTALINKENEIKGEIVEDLIIDKYTSIKSLEERFKYLEININKKMIIMVIFIERQIENKKYLYNKLKEFFIKKNMNSIIYFKGSKYTTIIQAKKEEDNLSSFYTELYSFFKFNNINIKIGIGGQIHNISNFKQAYNKALISVPLGEKIEPKNNIYKFSELKIYSLLWKIKDDRQTIKFYNDNIGKIIEYDEKHNTNLCQTLKNYFKNNLNKVKTAQKMYIHRNTLNYRLKSIEKITNYNLNNQNDKMSLQIGLYLKPFINGH